MPSESDRRAAKYIVEMYWTDVSPNVEPAIAERVAEALRPEREAGERLVASANGAAVRLAVLGADAMAEALLDAILAYEEATR